MRSHRTFSDGESAAGIGWRRPRLARPLLWIVLAGIGTPLLLGCANSNVSFKRGASPGAMAEDEKACRSSTSGEEAYQECMRGRGYLLPGSRTAPGDSS